MSNTVKKVLLFLLAIAVSLGFFSLSYLFLAMDTLDAAIVPTCILVFTICLLFLQSDEE